MGKGLYVTEFFTSKRSLFRLISKDNIEEIHEGSLAILEKAGVNVKSNEVMISLRNAGCEADSDGKIIRIPRSLVKESLSKIDPVLKLYGRDGKHERIIGSDNVTFNPGSSAVYFSDHKTGQTRQPVSKDLVDLVRTG